MLTSHKKNYLLPLIVLLEIIGFASCLVAEDAEIIPTESHINNEDNLELEVFRPYKNLTLKIIENSDITFPASYSHNVSSIEAPYNYNITIEDSDSTNGKLISTNGNPAFTLDLYPEQIATQNIKIKPAIESEDTGLLIKSINDNGYVHENIILETSNINATKTAVEVANKVKSLKFIGSSIGYENTATEITKKQLNAPQIGLHIKKDNGKASKIKSDIYCWSPIRAITPIQLDGNNYTVDLKSTVKATEQGAAIAITGSDNTILVENESSIASDNLHFMLDRESTNNTIEINQNHPIAYAVNHNSKNENTIKIYSSEDNNKNYQQTSNQVKVNKGKLNIVNNGIIISDISVAPSSNLNLRNDNKLENKEINIKGNAELTNNGTISSVINIEGGGILELKNDKTIDKSLTINIKNNGKLSLINNDKAEFTGIINIEDGGIIDIRNDNIIKINKPNNDTTPINIQKDFILVNNSVFEDNLVVAENGKLKITNDGVVQGDVLIKGEAELINNGEIKRDITTDKASTFILRNDSKLNNTLNIAGISQITNNGDITSNINLEDGSELTLANDKTLDSEITIKGKLNLINDGTLVTNKTITIRNGTLTLRNDTPVYNTPINIIDVKGQPNSRLELINNSILDNEKIKIDEDSVADVIINNDKDILSDIQVSHAGTFELNNHGNIKNKFILNNKGNTTIKNHKIIKNNIESTNNLKLTNVSTGTIEGKISTSGNSELINAGIIHNHINITIDETTTDNVEFENDNYIEGDVIFTLNKYIDKQNTKIISSTNKGERTRNGTNHFIGWHNGSIDVNNDETSAKKIIHVNNQGGVITGDIGNSNANNIVLENLDEGYWGTIKAKYIYADSIINNDYAIILSSGKTKAKYLINGEKSILSFNDLEIDTELARADNVVTNIETKSILFANTIKSSDDSQIKIQLKTNGIIATGKINNAEIHNMPQTKLFIDDNVAIINNKNPRSNNTNNIKLKADTNDGVITAKTITLHTNIINNDSLVAQSIAGNSSSSLCLITNKDECTLFCNELKNIKIVNYGSIKVQNRIAPIIQKEDIICSGTTQNSTVTEASIKDTLEAIEAKNKSLNVNSFNIPTEADLKKIYENINTRNKKLNTENQLYCKGKVEIAFVARKNSTNTSDSDKMAAEVTEVYNTPSSTFGFSDGIYITTDETAPTTEVFLYKTDANNTTQLPLDKEMIKGKITNNNGTIKLFAGSHLDEYDDRNANMPGPKQPNNTLDEKNTKPGKIKIIVDEDIKNFATATTDKALIYVNKASIHEIYTSNIELFFKNPKKNTPGKYNIRIVSANEIKVNDNDEVTNISDGAITDSSGNYILTKHRVEKQQQATTNTANDNLRDIEKLPEDLEAYTTREMLTFKNKEDDFDQQNTTSNSQQLTSDIVIGGTGEPIKPTVPDPEEKVCPTNPIEKVSPITPGVKKLTREITNHRQTQRLVSAYLYKYSCLSCNFEQHVSCLAPEKQSIWIKTALGHMQQAASSNSYQDKSNLKSLLIGADHRLDKTTVGVAVALNDIDATIIATNDQATTNSYSFIVYANHLQDNWFINTQLSHNRAKHNLASAEYTTPIKNNSSANNLQAIIGTCWYQGQVQVNPVASVRLANINLNGYTAIDTDNNSLSIADSSYNYADIGGGGSIQSQFYYKNMLLNFRTNLMIYRNMSDNKYKYNYQENNLDKSINIDAINKYYYELELGIDLNNYNNWVLSVELLHNWDNKFESSIINLLLRYIF